MVENCFIMIYVFSLFSYNDVLRAVFVLSIFLPIIDYLLLSRRILFIIIRMVYVLDLYYILLLCHMRFILLQAVLPELFLYDIISPSTRNSLCLDTNISTVIVFEGCYD